MEVETGVAVAVTADQKPSYKSLPHKRQLFLLLLSRLTEPLIASSIHSYMFFQLRHFNPTASASTIATQSGLIIGSKTAAHVCTGLLWGRLADHHHVGRKKVLVIGLLTSSLATVGYGFSETFAAAITWQVLDGAMNSTVAMARCMVSELNPEKRYRARALTLLPLFANLGSLLGPLIGGFLAATKSSSAIITRYPYAAPNVCVASIQAIVAIGVIFNLKETLEGYYDTDYQSHLPDHTKPSTTYTSPAHDSVQETTPLLLPPSPRPLPSTSATSLPFRHIWTPNVLSTMLAQSTISGHLGTFSTLWAIFLSTPTIPLPSQKPPLHFSGGLGMQPRSVGIAMSLLGSTGILLQILIYPLLQDRLGTIRLWRVALGFFPVVYILAPFCALIASWGKAGREVATGSLPVVWIALLFILVLFVVGRTCVVPATSLLINDCTPHPSVRGTIHTAGVISSNISKSIFPPIAFAVFGLGLKIGVVGLGFWFVAGLAVLACVVSCWVKEGTNGKQAVA